MTIQRLRADAIRRTLFAPTSLKTAIERLGFIQADPIRAPARAQDLILRHRVKNYRAGDLERRYPKLDIEEDVLYAYGFLPRANWRLLHPRDTVALTQLESRVLDLVKHYGKMHPRELEAHLGRERVVNAWGGYSKTTTHALQRLHYRGLLRIARRENGIRIYEAAPSFTEPLSPDERLKKLVLLLAKIFAPIPLVTLRELVHYLTPSAPGLENKRFFLQALLKRGELESAEVDGLMYAWPPGTLRSREPAEGVRFLAPFDPLVWDRRRFEHLWGWRYRFEAYTPVGKRQRGYYALPLLWKDAVIGWANVSLQKERLALKAGFIGNRPRSVTFRRALEDELARMETFLLARAASDERLG